MLFHSEKLLYKLNDIKYINIPKLDELSVPKILELIKDDVEMKTNDEIMVEETKEEEEEKEMFEPYHRS